MTDPDHSSQAGIGPLNYDELPGLEDVYLEDSFVREIVESDTYVSFTLVVALLKDHPLWEDPPRGERHCYRLGALTFPAVRSKKWHERAAPAYSDRGGALDQGNIDVLVAEPGGFYHVEGEWGSLDVASAAPQLDLTGDEPHARVHRAHHLRAWLTGQPVVVEDDGHDHHH
jgi:hypothetical protein